MIAGFASPQWWRIELTRAFEQIHDVGGRALFVLARQQCSGLTKPHIVSVERREVSRHCLSPVAAALLVSSGFPSPIEPLDPQVLFDPRKKQLDIPAIFIESTDGCSRQHALVGKKQQRLAGLWVLESDAPQMLRIVLARLDAREHDGLITDNAVCTVGGCGVEAPCVYVRLRASYKKGTGLM